MRHFNRFSRIFLPVSGISTDRNLIMFRHTAEHGIFKRRFAALALNMDTAKVFYKDDKKIWVCRNCGYETYDWQSREKCPVCGADQGFSQIKPENY